MEEEKATLAKAMTEQRNELEQQKQNLLRRHEENPKVEDAMSKILVMIGEVKSTLDSQQKAIHDLQEDKRRRVQDA